MVQGIDNAVLEVFFRMDAATVDKLTVTYELLFGSSAAAYMRQVLPAWYSEQTGVSGLNAARTFARAFEMTKSDSMKALQVAWAVLGR